MYDKNDRSDEIDLTKVLHSTKQLERKILSYWEMNDLVHHATINKLWNGKITNEIKRRKNCVTVYTWFSNKIPVESYSDNGIGVRIRGGHSALRTYGNSSGEEGIYVSFYGGDCHTAKRKACRKTTSHFHSWGEEMDKATRESAQAVDIYGLDVDAIHQAFHELHDEEMNSEKDWGPLYNCSDVVFLLLKKGDIENNLQIFTAHLLSDQSPNILNLPSGGVAIICADQIVRHALNKSPYQFFSQYIQTPVTLCTDAYYFWRECKGQVSLKNIAGLVNLILSLAPLILAPSGSTLALAGTAALRIFTSGILAIRMPAEVLERIENAIENNSSITEDESNTFSL